MADVEVLHVVACLHVIVNLAEMNKNVNLLYKINENNHNFIEINDQTIQNTAVYCNNY